MKKYILLPCLFLFLTVNIFCKGVTVKTETFTGNTSIFETTPASNLKNEVMITITQQYNKPALYEVRYRHKGFYKTGTEHSYNTDETIIPDFAKYTFYNFYYYTVSLDDAMGMYDKFVKFKTQHIDDGLEIYGNFILTFDMFHYHSPQENTDPSYDIYIYIEERYTTPKADKLFIIK